MIETRRLFVGGLFADVTEVDLRERFSGFGQITSVNIKHRQGTDGSHEKSFAHLSIEGTAAELNKCISMYNKTKWKGKELHLQLARESFLERLRKERESPAENITVKTESIEESAEPATVTLTVPGATPGTQVPGKKDWVVAKYSEVLPVVTMRSKDKKKMLKMDPSKYVHNVKRFGHKKQEHSVTEDPKEVDKLTWKIEHDDKEITRRQKGEFPNYISQSRKKFTPPVRQEAERHVEESDDDIEVVAMDTSQNGGTTIDLDSDSADSDDTDEIIRSTKSHDLSSALTPGGNVIQKPRSSDKQFANKNNSSSNVMKQDIKKSTVKKIKVTHKPKSAESDCDSSDTDEIIATSFGKKEQQILERRVPQITSSRQTITTSMSSGQADEFSSGFTESSAETARSSYYHSDEEEDLLDVIQRTGKVPKGILSQKVSLHSHRGAVQRSQCKGRSDGNKNINKIADRSDITVDLKQIDGNRKQISASTNWSSESESDDNDTSYGNKQKKVSTKSSPIEITRTGSKSDAGVRKTSTDKSKIVGSDSDSSDSEDSDEIPCAAKHTKQAVKNSTNIPPTEIIVTEIKIPTKQPVKKKSTTQMSLTADQSKNLSLKESHNQSGTKHSAETKLKKNSVPDSENGSSESDSDSSSSSDSESSESVTLETNQTGKSVSQNKTDTSSTSESDTDSDSSDEGKSIPMVAKLRKDLDTSEHSPAGKSRQKTEAGISRQKTESGNSEKQVKVMLAGQSQKEKELANQKRLESLKQKQTETRAQKSAIKEALKSVDKKSPSSKHIVFNSDSETELEPDAPKAAESSSSTGKVAPRLFDSSDEEEAEDGMLGTNKEDADMFRHKPQFEGKAGMKLMNLQSRYKNDERFRLDERFAKAEKEDESEEEMDVKPDEDVNEVEDERKRALSILKSVVGGGAVTTAREKKDKNTFRSMSTMHFDPSREDHNQFEIKVKPSKKKEDSSEKLEENTDAPLPEVSTEKFYEVSSSLKSMFGNQESFSFLGGSSTEQKEQNSGFKFLGENADLPDDNTDKTETAESATVSKTSLSKRSDSFSWEHKFSDESSDEEMEEDKSVQSGLTEVAKTKATKHTFFFTSDDPRIKEGIDFFHRKEDMNTIRESWAEKRPALVESYKMKRKNLTRNNVYSQFKKLRT